jgi:DNA polymerase I-like protein with 3'-5' exonuclease and polymerase domains
MTVYDDDVGMFWEVQPKQRVPTNHVFTPRALPDCDWTAPTSLPTLRNRGIKKISFDVETRDDDLPKLGPGTRRGSYIVGIALGTDIEIDGKSRWYFPVAHEGGGNMDAAMVRSWAKDELNAFDGEVVGAHILYDLEFAATDGWDVTFKNSKGFHDILLAEPLIDEWRPNGYSMDDVADYHLGEGKRHEMLYAWGAANGWTTERQVKSNLWRAPARFVGAYGEGDADLPLRVLEKQQKIIDDEDLQQVYDLERGLLPLMLAMRLRGVPVNVQRAEEVNSRLILERDKWLGEVRRLSGNKAAELMAPDSFAQALADRGFNIPRTAKKGKLSVTKPWLAMQESANDGLVTAILEGRRVDKIINTYTGNILEHNVRGRIYAEFPQLRGENGGTMARFSSAKPNLQNQPARDAQLGPMTRSIFEPEDGEVFERQDESQIEYRLLTHFASLTKYPGTNRHLQGAEEARLSYVNDPKTDFHKMTATLVGIDPEDKILRKRVKNINFCRVYMGGDDKIAQTAGIPLAEARAFGQEYDRKLPFVRQMGMIAMGIAESRGYIKTIMGRRQRFTLWEPRQRQQAGESKNDRKARMLLKEQALIEYGPNIRRAFCHAGLNRLLQGSAADVIKKAMLDIWKSGVCDVLGAPLITVHDELDWSIPRSPAADKAAAEARHIMETAVDLTLPMRVDWSRGENWGVCE